MAEDYEAKIRENLIKEIKSKPLADFDDKYIAEIKKAVESQKKNFASAVEYSEFTKAVYKAIDDRKNKIGDDLYNAKNSYQTHIDNFYKSKDYTVWNKKYHQLVTEMLAVINKPDDTIYDKINDFKKRYQSIYEQNPKYTYEFGKLKSDLKWLKGKDDLNRQYNTINNAVDTIDSTIQDRLNSLKEMIDACINKAVDYATKKKAGQDIKDKIDKSKKDFDEQVKANARRKQDLNKKVKRQLNWENNWFVNRFSKKEEKDKAEAVIGKSEFIKRESDKQIKKLKDKKIQEAKKTFISGLTSKGLSQEDAEKQYEAQKQTIEKKAENDAIAQFNDPVNQAPFMKGINDKYDAYVNNTPQINKAEQTLGSVNDKAQKKAKAQTDKINKKKKDSQHNSKLLKTIGSMIAKSSVAFIGGLGAMLGKLFKTPPAEGMFNFIKTAFKIGLGGFGMIQLSKLIRFFMRGHDFSNEKEVYDIMGPLWGDLVHYARNPKELFYNIWNKFTGKKEVKQASERSNRSLKDYMKNLFFNADAVSTDLNADTSKNQGKLKEFFGDLKTSIREISQTILDLGKIIVAIPHSILQTLASLNLGELVEKAELIGKDNKWLMPTLDFITTAFANVKAAGVSGLKTLYNDAVVSYMDIQANAEKFKQQSAEQKTQQVLGSTDNEVIKSAEPIEKKQLECNKSILELQYSLQKDDLTDEQRVEKQKELGNLQVEINKLNKNIEKKDSIFSSTPSISGLTYTVNNNPTMNTSTNMNNVLGSKASLENQKQEQKLSFLEDIENRKKKLKEDKIETREFKGWTSSVLANNPYADKVKEDIKANRKEYDSIANKVLDLETALSENELTDKEKVKIESQIKDYNARMTRLNELKDSLENESSRLELTGSLTTLTSDKDYYNNYMKRFTASGIMEERKSLKESYNKLHPNDDKPKTLLGSALNFANGLKTDLTDYFMNDKGQLDFSKLKSDFMNIGTAVDNFYSGGADNPIVQSSNALKSWMKEFGSKDKTSEQRQAMLSGLEKLKNNFIGLPQVNGNGSLPNVENKPSNTVLAQEIDTKLKNYTNINLNRPKNYTPLPLDDLKMPPFYLTTGGTNILNSGAREA